MWQHLLMSTVLAKPHNCGRITLVYYVIVRRPSALNFLSGKLFCNSSPYGVGSPIPGRRAMCQAGRVSIRRPPHAEQTIRRPTSGTNASPGSWSTTTSALWRQSGLRHVAIRAFTLLVRILPSVMGAPGVRALRAGLISVAIGFAPGLNSMTRCGDKKNAITLSVFRQNGVNVKRRGTCKTSEDVGWRANEHI
jgi:hypothetical protein